MWAEYEANMDEPAGCLSQAQLYFFNVNLYFIEAQLYYFI